ncbi:IncF transfer coupling protein TraD [Escherichia coli]|uniref:IncF transfer coupling protein TraD n=1 Tax=Escherichia coli TaxID=562 RepID=A0A376ZWU1_ECOLX|nr:IncF transfer coupling protein TraD [Escherichia coli]
MSFNAKDMTQGGQIASMRIRMFSQIANIILYCLFIFFWILVGLVLWVKNKLADVCEWLHLLVVHHAGRHAGFNQVPAGL